MSLRRAYNQKSKIIIPAVPLKLHFLKKAPLSDSFKPYALTQPTRKGSTCFYKNKKAFFLSTQELQTSVFTFLARTNRQFSQKLSPKPSPSKFLNFYATILTYFFCFVNSFSKNKSYTVIFCCLSG